MAVKVLSIELESLEGEREFISEVTALSDIKHENLITLTGCCISGADRFLIYDYMENNSLALAFQGTTRAIFLSRFPIQQVYILTNRVDHPNFLLNQPKSQISHLFAKLTFR